MRSVADAFVDLGLKNAGMCVSFPGHRDDVDLLNPPTVPPHSPGLLPFHPLLALGYT